ncbi:acyl-CoA dehydrogenase [Ferrimonas lipolytica]|uniref:Acyl-CoA dehydrogenase n=1 Tax=Ferrimonas lipolytica TaxID=2724191 RepID=A0A6H1UFG6_9GAMM|nr:acyl-CoA dehydrogenase [Ferrimonas lipolytica]QIZ76956.1 acyl-CoA dehydrogenase [Ferrimonas lipolytica]
MSEFINQRELEFLLYDLLDSEQLLQLDRFADHDRTIFDEVINTAHRIAAEHYANHYKLADENEPTFDGKTVTTPDAVKTAWKHYAEAGFLSAGKSYEVGGMQLPYTINAAIGAQFAAANISTAAYPFLTGAAANVIEHSGTQEQRQRYLEPMLTGRFSGTMALTEPDVGSSLGDLTTKAILQHDGSYLISGNKIYISGGDQDITENIVHLVLARIEGAPVGSKGISLFIVPKFHVNDDGSLGARNDVQLTGLLHKMGYRGTTSTALNFGENGNCSGYLIGEANKGLRAMFQMMNEARIWVGIGASALGYRGYLESLDYAKNRPQGRKATEKSSHSKPVNIIEHSDVKRMLLAQKAYSEGSMALSLYAAQLVDKAEAGNDGDAAELLELLTPIVKSFPSHYGPRANDLAIQVLAGAGYTREYNLEQLYRDNRLNPIHEGTFGIQSLDLLGRKLWQNGSKGLQLLMAEFQQTVALIEVQPRLKPQLHTFAAHLLTVSSTIETLGGALKQGKVEQALANSALFLDMMGKLVVSWIWLKMAERALVCYGSSELADDQAFVAGKLQAAQYFIQWELPEIEHQARLLTDFDDSCSAMQPDWF